MKGKIFNAQEVQSMIAGNKTQFREVIKPQPKNTRYCGKNSLGAFIFHEKEMQDYVELIHCPYQVGQKIFCKESFADFRSNNSDIFYKSDFEINNLAKIAELKWSPAQHMKQEHSRLTLQIKEIRVERLQDISEEDAIAEGFKNTFVGFQHPVYNAGRTANQDFEIFWNATHKKPEEKFGANPWVWKIDFEVVKC
jgi:hypothetical protein